MTVGKSQEKPVRFHTIGKDSPDAELSLKCLTTTKIDRLEKALAVIKEANLPIRVDIGIELLEEVKRLREIIKNSQ